MKTYSTNDLIKIFGLSRQRFEQLRNGHMNNYTIKGKFALYKVEPYLIEGKDWIKEKYQIIFTENAIQKLNKKYQINSKF